LDALRDAADDECALNGAAKRQPAGEKLILMSAAAGASRTR